MSEQHQDVTNALLQQHLKEQDSKLDKLVYAIEGNGKPGLKDRVLALEAFVLPLKKFGWIVITATVTTAVTSCVGLTIVIIKMINGAK